MIWADFEKIVIRALEKYLGRLKCVAFPCENHSLHTGKTTCECNLKEIVISREGSCRLFKRKEGYKDVMEDDQSKGL